MILNHYQNSIHKSYNSFLPHNYLSFLSIHPLPMFFLPIPPSLFILISHYFLTSTWLPFSESNLNWFRLTTSKIRDIDLSLIVWSIALYSYYLIFFRLNSQLQLWKVFFLFNFNWTDRFVHFLLSLILILYCSYQISFL